MKNTLFFVIVFAFLAMLLPACSLAQATTPIPNTSPLPQTATLPQPTTLETYNDAFAYCNAVGTIDQPDERYTGPQMTEEILNGYIKAAGLNADAIPSDVFMKSTIWRCMDHKVYTCNFGANLPCNSKANTEKTPTQAMVDFCKENKDSIMIPMSVTGHSTIYTWRCVQDTPELLDQVDQADAAGYLTRIWYAIEPTP